MDKGAAAAAHKSRGASRPKKRGPVQSSAAKWLLKNQFGVSFNLLALLFLSHCFIPASRQYTTKFFSLSYRNAQTGKYAAGYDDFYFMTFRIVLLTCLRAGFMHHVLAPLAQRWGVAGKNATRFAEQGWMLIYYNVFWPTGMYLYYNSKYFGHMEELWTDWPQREIGGLMKAYILGQWSFWIQQILVINIEERRKDHWQMLTHHFVTIALMAGCYAYHQTRVGNLILVLMDVIDLFLPLAKCLKYLGFGVICDVVFGGFIVSWIIARHVLHILTCWSVYTDLPRIQKEVCYRGSADNLQGPFAIPTSGWSHLLEPFRDPQGVVCFNNNITYAFLSFLLFLQVMMIMWFTFIVRIVVRMFQGKPAEDVRSNSEAEDSEEQAEDTDEMGRPQYLEMEVDAEAINWTARASAAQVSSSGSSVHFRGHTDRKELLNRIGCGKQIE
ncbi:TRAM1 & fumonisin [Cordyceps militaris]|uniref:TRAM1 & fumonisin n=1 Tax=Cordyceps militaris TaxID=73501 RepID=A0A2H4SMU1_CORMI|nr:TRAM1 & fumonisin [Cordyceps militaris]